MTKKSCSPVEKNASIFPDLKTLPFFHTMFFSGALKLLQQEINAISIVDEAFIHLSHEKKTVGYFPWNTGCLIGILIMIHYN